MQQSNGEKKTSAGACFALSVFQDTPTAQEKLPFKTIPSFFPVVTDNTEIDVRHDP